MNAKSSTNEVIVRRAPRHFLTRCGGEGKFMGADCNQWAKVFLFFPGSPDDAIA